MQRRVLVGELGAHIDQQVEIAGWLHRQRQLSHVSFLIIRDRSGLGQVVITDADQARQLATATGETVMAVRGRCVRNEKAPGGVELHGPEIEILAAPAQAPPIDVWRPELTETLPVRLDLAPLALRHPRQRATFQLAAAAIAGFRQTLTGAGFTEVQTPKIVGSATESGANVFTLDYFGRPAYLAQSPQFYKQTMVGVFERVFETGPVFRAEPHDTPRHLSEYVSLDAEIGFITDYHDVIAILRDAIAGMLTAITRDSQPAIELLDLQVPLVPGQIPEIDFTAALELISADTGADLAGENDLAPAHERWLGDWAAREHRSEFVFVTGYPMSKRPFYTHPNPDRPTVSNSFDLLFRGLELVTGGQRLHHYEDYIAALLARDQDPADYAGYLAAFEYGMPPHGGFAIGLERFIARLTGAANVRETTLFPRDLTRLTP
jgi:nondiscriminating aspartyl-tRNA synthetase